MTNNPQRLSDVPNKLLFGHLSVPSNSQRVRLNPPQTIRMIGGTQKLQPDGIWAYRQNGRLTCIAFQAEESTGRNISALLGKALFCQLCGDDYSLIRVDEEIEDDEDQPKKYIRPVRVDRLITVFLYQATNVNVAKSVEGVLQCLNPVNHFARHTFAVPIHFDKLEDAASELQIIINNLPKM